VCHSAFSTRYLRELEFLTQKVLIIVVSDTESLRNNRGRSARRGAFSSGAAQDSQLRRTRESAVKEPNDGIVGGHANIAGQ
jgi:hypothetical protein